MNYLRISRKVIAYPSFNCGAGEELAPPGGTETGQWEIKMCLLGDSLVEQCISLCGRLRDWFQIGKGECQGCILSPCFFKLYAEYIMWKKKQRHHFAGKDLYGQSYGFSSSHVWMGQLEYKKAECWRIDAFELWCWRTLESPLDCEEIQPVNPKRNQLWIFIGRTVAEAPILWSSDAKRQFIGKGPDAGKDERQKEKRMSEDKMVGWHHWLNGHEFEQTLGDSGGQRSLVCYNPWGRKELDMTERLNWTVNI